MHPAGTGLGVIAALGLTHLMSSMLFGVKPTDVPTFVLVVLDALLDRTTGLLRAGKKSDEDRSRDCAAR